MAKVTKKAPMPTQLDRIEKFFNRIAPDLIKRLDKAEMRANHAEKELSFLQTRLRTLLTSDQLEAAQICGVTPEMYCIELIELWKEKIWTECPIGILPLHTLRGGSF